MTENKTISSLDITNWFCKKAETASLRLSETKIQHLLFLSQMHFIIKYGRYLSPTLFVCDNYGFFDPTIRAILRFGLPLMTLPTFSHTTNNFLELIWQKYANLSDIELNKFITSLKCFKQYNSPKGESIVNPMTVVDSFASSLNRKESSVDSKKTKIMISQNGPVKVSAWNPRKISTQNKGE